MSWGFERVAREFGVDGTGGRGLAEVEVEVGGGEGAEVGAAGSAAIAFLQRDEAAGFLMRARVRWGVKGSCSASMPRRGRRRPCCAASCSRSRGRWMPAQKMRGWCGLGNQPRPRIAMLMGAGGGTRH